MSNFKDKIQFSGENQGLFDLSCILISAVKMVLRQKGDIYLSSDPVVHEKGIVQFAQRMRIDGLEKFNARTVIATVNFFLDKDRMVQEGASGALILYIPEDYVARLMWLMDYGRINEDDDRELLESGGAVANLISGAFVKELSANGYGHLQMSHFATYMNNVVNGVDFSAQENVKHEIEFFIRGDKKLVAELTMLPLKRY